MRKKLNRLPASLALALLAPCATASAQDHRQAEVAGLSVPGAQHDQGQLTVGGKVPVADLLDAYGLVLPELSNSTQTVADLFARAHPKGSRVGSKVALGPLGLVAKEVADGRVTATGLLLRGGAAG